MLNIKKYMVMACALLSLNGCDYLDYNETSGKTKEEAYAYYDNMNQLVAYVYTFLPSDLGSCYRQLHLHTGKCEYQLYDQRSVEPFETGGRRLESLGRYS